MMTNGLDDAIGEAHAAVIVAAASAAMLDAQTLPRLGDLAICALDARAAGLPVIAANPAFLAATGYAVDRIVGLSCIVLGAPGFAPDDAPPRAGPAKDGPFRSTLAIRRENGDVFRSEAFLSPVKDEGGATTRYVAILLPGPVARDDEGDALAALRHGFRNQIQTMNSLVTLFGQRLPPGEGHDAFTDLRARFEATAALHADDAGSAGADHLLAALAERLRLIYDPARAARFTASAAPIAAGARRRAVLAQIMAELVIDLFRNARWEGGADVAIGPTDAGGIRLAVLAPGAVATRRSAASSLGLTILDSLVRGLDGAMVRTLDAGLAVEIVLPPESARR